MTIVYKANRIEGLSTDTKPTNLYTNRIFYETDTNKNFVFQNNAWTELSSGGGWAGSIFGSGTDGDATNPALSGTNYKSYNNLTINSPTTWSGNGNIYIRVAGTLNITSTLTLANNHTDGLTPQGGIKGGQGGNGGAAGQTKGTVMIIANEVTGNGTITSTGNNGVNGSNGTSYSSGGQGTDGDNGQEFRFFGQSFGYGVGGHKGQAGSPANFMGQQAQQNHTFNLDPDDWLNPAFWLDSSQGGAGGGGGGSSGYAGGTRGGQGGSSFFAQGGYGGRGKGWYNGSWSSGGGGGGGASPVFLGIITPSLSALTYTFTAGNGGAAGQGGNTGYSGANGGGGGGSVSILKIADSNTGTHNLTAGTGGIGNSTTYSTGETGGNGTTQVEYWTYSDFEAYLGRTM